MVIYRMIHKSGSNVRDPDYYENGPMNNHFKNWKYENSKKLIFKRWKIIK